MYTHTDSHKDTHTDTHTQRHTDTPPPLLHPPTHTHTHTHTQADGSLLVAAVGLVCKVNRRTEGSVDSTDFDDGDEEEEDGDVPATFVEVFVLKQKVG